MMNKKKTSGDRNAKPRASSRNPSISSLYTRPNAGHRKMKPEKSPSTQILQSGEPENLPKSVQVTKAVEACVPKTRFNSQDRCRELRSYSSPRLKYFPAEKIKKFESPPVTPIGALIAQQNPHEAGVYYVAGNTDLNNGQGDAAAPSQSLHQHRPPQHVHSVAQQQVAPHQPIHQTNPQSESILPQQILAGQAHRPFVPHGPREQSPQKVNTQPGYHDAPSAMKGQPVHQPVGHQAPSQSVPAMDQARKPEEPAQQPDYEKQPIGGRNAANYRQMMAGQQPQPQSQAMNPNVTASNHEQQFSKHVAQNPQNVYQQMQQNMQQQQQMQQRAANYQMQMMGNQQVQAQTGAQQYGRYTPQGMTSPQDQMKNMQRAATPGNQMNQRNLEHSMNPQNGWPMNNQIAEYSSVKAQLKPYNVEVMNNQARHGVHPYHHPMLQHRAMPKTTPQNVPMAYHQPGQEQQMTVNEPPNPQPPANNKVSQNNQKKPLQFTAGMLRDQEKLLKTMKQQGVPLDVMRRQFDMLLNEQKKHLQYLEQIQRQDENEEVKSVQVNPRRKRNVDEKPDWMAHLTPTRMSYLEMERLREQQKKEEEGQRGQQQNMSEMSNQPNPLQMQSQSYNWQQPGVPQPHNVYPHPYVTAGRTTPNAGQNLQAINHQQQQGVPQYQHVHQQQQQQFQHVVQQHQEQTESTNDSSRYQQDRPPAEPSSLLKMRQYLNEIRPQKRNNGLQDPQVARKQLEEFRTNAEMKKGLEYLANFSQKPQLKLNGIQDRAETETEIQKRLLVLSSEPAIKTVPANGLENTRNPDNPAPQRVATLKKLEQEFVKEYPRQRTSTPKDYYSVPAERENGTVANEQPRQQPPAQNPANMTPVMPRGNVMPFRFDANQPQHYQQMQQYYQNSRNLSNNNGEGDVGTLQRIEASKGNFERAGGDAYENMNGQMAESKVHFQGAQYGQPDIHEAKTIGGIRYLARKQDYLPHQQLVAPETLIASRVLQPPVLY